MSWKQVKLKDIGNVVTGSTPSKSKPEYYGGNIPFISPSEIGGQIYARKSNQFLTEEGGKVARLLPKNTVMVCCIGSLGKSSIAPTIVATNQQINSIIVNEEIADPIYVYFWCTTLRRILENIAPATTVAIVNKSRFSDLTIPLPTLVVQKQIADILEKADTLRNQCQQMEQELNSLAQSVFLDMFGNPVTNTKNWKMKKFKDVCTSQLGKMLSGKAKSGDNPQNYLRNANIRWRKIETHDLLKMDFNEKELSKFALEYGDLLVCEGGEVGRCAIWKNELSDCYYQKALHRVRVNRDFITPEYLQEYFFWMSKLGGLLSSTSEVTFSHLTAAKLAELVVPVPPLELQHQYIEKYKKIDISLVELEKMRLEVENNFNSLMQKAFKGQLDLKDVA